jgi:hypothetical protein
MCKIICNSRNEKCPEYCSHRKAHNCDEYVERKQAFCKYGTNFVVHCVPVSKRKAPANARVRKAKTETVEMPTIERLAGLLNDDFPHISLSFRDECLLKLSVPLMIALVRAAANNRASIEAYCERDLVKAVDEVIKAGLVWDEYDRVIDHLEAKAPQAKGKLCGNRTCSFYVGMLLMAARKEEGRIPPHSCLGLVGPTGPCGSPCNDDELHEDDFDEVYWQARKKEAERLKKDYPDIFKDMV